MQTVLFATACAPTRWDRPTFGVDRGVPQNNSKSPERRRATRRRDSANAEVFAIGRVHSSRTFDRGAPTFDRFARRTAVRGVKLPSNARKGCAANLPGDTAQ